MNTTLKTVSALAIAAATLTAATLVTGSAASASPHPPKHLTINPIITKYPTILKELGPHHVFNCLACNLPRPTPKPTPKPTQWGQGWGHGWGHGFGHLPEIVVGSPAPIAAPVQASRAAPMAAPQVAASPCNCLTKQSLPDGSVMFQDICTKEGAIMPPVTVGAR